MMLYRQEISDVARDRKVCNIKAYEMCYTVRADNDKINKICDVKRHLTGCARELCVLHI